MSLFAKELTERLPEGLDCIFFTCSGSEANVMATHLARAYTGNYSVISLQNGYHGTVGAQHLTNIGSWNHDIPKNHGITPACYPDLYRGPWSKD